MQFAVTHDSHNSLAEPLDYFIALQPPGGKSSTAALVNPQPLHRMICTQVNSKPNFGRRMTRDVFDFIRANSAL